MIWGNPLLVHTGEDAWERLMALRAGLITTRRPFRIVHMLDNGTMRNSTGWT